MYYDRYKMTPLEVEFLNEESSINKTHILSIFHLLRIPILQVKQSHE